MTRVGITIRINPHRNPPTTVRGEDNHWPPACTMKLPASRIANIERATSQITKGQRSIIQYIIRSLMQEQYILSSLTRINTRPAELASDRKSIYRKKTKRIEVLPRKTPLISAM